MRYFPLSLILLLYFSSSLSVSAQDKVLARKPYNTLDSSPGFITINELMAGFGLGETGVPYSKSFFGFTTTNGYQINKNFVVAGGTGFLVYNGGTLVPLFADIRYRMNTDPVTPYFFVDVGGLLDFNDIGASKLFFTGGLGGQYAFSKNVAVNLGTGIMIQSGGHRDTFIPIKAGVTYKF